MLIRNPSPLTYTMHLYSFEGGAKGNPRGGSIQVEGLKIRGSSLLNDGKEDA